MPERLGVEQLAQMLAQFQLPVDQPSLMPVEHMPPGLCDGVRAGLRCKPSQDLMPDPYIVQMAELVLQALQPPGERRNGVGRIERGRCFRRIAQLFQRDAQAMALLGRLLGELLASFLRGPPAAPQDPLRNLADRRLRPSPQAR